MLEALPSDDAIIQSSVSRALPETNLALRSASLKLEAIRSLTKQQDIVIALPTS